MQKSENASLVTKEDMEKLLKRKRGLQYFQMHLATELNLENLLFYESVEKWKSGYDDSDETIRTAYKIKELFFGEGSLALNLSDELDREVSEAFPHEFAQPPITVFDQAVEEVLFLMQTHSYPRFLNSDFYKLYTGELTAGQTKTIKSTGLSSFTILGARFNLSEVISEVSVSQEDG